jgi:hypothetical protein
VCRELKGSFSRQTPTEAIAQKEQAAQSTAVGQRAINLPFIVAMRDGGSSARFGIWCRSSIHPAAAGTAETRQPDRDLTEQGCDLVRPVVLDLARGGACPTLRLPGGMVPALDRNDRLLNLGQQLSAVRHGQAQIREVTQITRADDLQHIDASN